jgi:Bacterial SH3 domain
MPSSHLKGPDYKLRHAGESRAPELPMRALSEIAERFAPEPQCEDNEEAGLLEPPSRLAPTAETRRGLPLKALTAAVIVGALIPTTILVALLWQGTMQTRNDGTGAFSAAAEPEIALSSPERIEAKAGEVIDFPLAIDATEKLPSRSVVAVSAMPDGASFSEGRPYGATGWSLRPDEIGELRFRLPESRSGAFDMRIELLAADGAVLAQSETRLNVTAAPAEADTVSAVESSPFDQSAGMDAPKASEALPAPKRAPSAKVATVKVVTIKPAVPSRPHDGAFALGAAGDAPAEWVEIIRPVDMHARPEQSSETVKVVEKGLKFRVGARDKNWVQVSDPATSANGWIYSRFLKPTVPPVQ